MTPLDHRVSRLEKELDGVVQRIAVLMPKMPSPVTREELQRRPFYKEAAEIATNVVGNESAFPDMFMAIVDHASVVLARVAARPLSDERYTLPEPPSDEVHAVTAVGILPNWDTPR